MKSEAILIIEDEPDIKDVIEYNLKKEGYRIFSSLDGEEGLKLINTEIPNLVLLDLMLPGLDGLEVCRRLKEKPETRGIPIIMVTAKGEESDIVLGLGIGADDYITKPFSPRELVSRVKAVLRRGTLKKDNNKPPKIFHKGLVIDPGKYEVRVDDKIVVLTATEFKLLHYLAERPGQVFTRDQLINAAVNEDAFVSDRNIDVHVRAIRKKLDKHHDLIETIRGIGYRFTDKGES